jgi:hypothetical protein
LIYTEKLDFIKYQMKLVKYHNILNETSEISWYVNPRSRRDVSLTCHLYIIITWSWEERNKNSFILFCKYSKKSKHIWYINIYIYIYIYIYNIYLRVFTLLCIFSKYIAVFISIYIYIYIYFSLYNIYLRVFTLLCIFTKYIAVFISLLFFSVYYNN